ncbi:MAG: glutamate-1-semialdehyde 2,1-aminomutase [Gammaproteobacteria bacterium]|jgi:glutamate-1-semialdehyde 2,1-aminomutase|nr:glutamate-1-semialdehyde 2,1-aminomutase [Gammaproteobacteria bacterium]
MTFGNLTSEQISREMHRLIPGGSHTYSKGDDQFPANAPKVMARGKGAYCWDVENVEYLDWAMGNRVMSLGHAHDYVDQKVFEAMRLGANFTRPGILEYELAAYLNKLLPCAEMVKFGKNGSDVVTAAVKLARAYTGRPYVLVCGSHPFFAIHDWFIGSTEMNAGTLESERPYTVKFIYGDVASVEAAFEAHKGQIAALILEPVKNDSPYADPRPSDLTKDGMNRNGDNTGNFLFYLREKTSKEGTVLIFDEMIAGMRFGLRGAHHLYGIYPDLATYGKAISNGYSCSVLAGRRDIMNLGGITHDRERVFLLSQTHGSETVGLAATLATMQFYEEHKVDDHIWAIGHLLKTGVANKSAEHGLSNRVRIIGFEANPQILCFDENGLFSSELNTLFHQFMVEERILIPWITITYAHGVAEVERTIDAVGRSLARLKDAIAQDRVRQTLLGPPQKPVFRKFN